MLSTEYSETKPNKWLTSRAKLAAETLVVPTTPPTADEISEFVFEVFDRADPNGSSAIAAFRNSIHDVRVQYLSELKDTLRKVKNFCVDTTQDDIVAFLSAKVESYVP